MRKRVIVGVVSAGILLLGAIGSQNQPQSPDLNIDQPVDVTSVAEKATEAVKPICDGVAVTINCTVDGVSYSTYVHYPAVPEKSHTETVTTYKKEITSYCTLCSDGTFSPSCATGRGACSHHGGVAQWNAPRYSNVPEYGTRAVVDMPAQEAYYEKSIE